MKIVCPCLGTFDLRDPAAVREAFACAPGLPMQQAWRGAPEEKFLPARVRIGWRDNRFLIFGELSDNLLFTRATRDNQLLCTLGDVFEIFLRDAGGGSYAEFHVAPNGLRLQLLWPDAATFRRVGKEEVSLEELKVPEPIFDFSQWSEGRTWCICASVPASVFLPAGIPLPGRRWMVSFSRYDYSSPEEPPVLSSTSPHAEVSFHRQQEWTEVEFVLAGGTSQ